MPQLMWIRIKSYLHNLLVLWIPNQPQLSNKVWSQKLNLVMGKLIDRHINSRNAPNHFSQGFLNPHGGRIHLEPHVQQYLSQGNPTLELHRRQDSMDKTTQQQVTKVGNTELPTRKDEKDYRAVYEFWERGRRRAEQLEPQLQVPTHLMSATNSMNKHC